MPIVGGLKVTPEIALGYWREIIGECDELGLSKILLEHNFVEMISMAEMVEIIGPVGRDAKGATFAFLDRYGHYDVPEAGKRFSAAMKLNAIVPRPRRSRKMAAGKLKACRTEWPNLKKQKAGETNSPARFIMLTASYLPDL
jgi:hypothetical protein